MTLIEQIDDILPQTQCRQCGYDGCMAYACAIAMEGAPINRCAPGGQKGIDELARLLDRPSCTLDPEYGQEVPLEVAQINAEQCIGCRKCVAVCPTGAIHELNFPPRKEAAPAAPKADSVKPAAPAAPKAAPAPKAETPAAPSANAEAPKAAPTNE